MIEKFKLDELNKRLLYELNYNCRQSDKQIAKKLRSSKQVIRYRIKKLENAKIITAYNAIIDFRALGFTSLRMYLKLQNTTPKIEQEISNYIKQNDIFLWSVNFEGDIDIAFYVWVKKVDEFYSQWEEFFNLYGKYILKQELFLSINMIHYPMKLFYKPKNIEVWNIGENKSQISINELDLYILKILSRNANNSLVEIAKKVNSSTNVVAYRIKQLESKKIILAYNAIIDEKKIGYLFYKIDFYLQSHTKLTDMYEFARQHSNIKNIMKTIGGPDFEIEVLVKDVSKLHELINEIKTKFSENIKHWRYNRITKTIKQVYLPIDFK